MTQGNLNKLDGVHLWSAGHDQSETSFQETWSLFDLLDDFGSGVQNGPTKKFDPPVKPETLQQVGVKQEPQTDMMVVPSIRRPKRKMDEAAQMSSQQEGGNKDKRLVNARMSRLKRKKELVELRLRIAQLEREQMDFLSKISDLEAEAHFLQHSGSIDLKSENNLLKEEIREHKMFVARLQSLMQSTCTSAREFQTHAEKTDRLQLRRRCVECVENSMNQCIGLARVSSEAMWMRQQGLPSSWKTSTFEGNEDFEVHYELLPKGCEFKDALRMNSRLDFEFPMDMQSTSKLLRSMHHDKRYKEMLHDHNILVLENLFQDDDYENKVCDETGVLKARYFKERLGNRVVSKVGVLMAKAVPLQESYVVPNGDPRKDIPCILHCIADANHIFPEVSKFHGDKAIAAEPTTNTALTVASHVDGAEAVDYKKSFSEQKFFISTSIIRELDENRCSLSLVRSECIDKTTRESMCITEDGVFSGQSIKRMIDVIQHLKEKMLVEKGDLPLAEL